MNEVELQKSLYRRARQTKILGLSKGIIMGIIISLGISLCKDLNLKHTIGISLIGAGVVGSLQYFIDS